MSLQGSVIVVAETSVPDVVRALSEAGAFPVVEAKWSEASAAFQSVQPAAIVIAEPGAPMSTSAAHALALQIAAATGPIIPVIARVDGDTNAAVPTALPVDVSSPVARVVDRLHSALRVRALHATVLRRIETYTAHGLTPAELSAHDALEDATVLILGRGPLYPALTVAIGEQVNIVGSLSVEAAVGHLGARDIDGIIVGDGFSQRHVDAFLTLLAETPRLRDIPVATIGRVPDRLSSTRAIERVIGDPVRIISRMLPLVRMRAFEMRLQRVLTSIEAGGIFDPNTGLLTHDAFGQDLAKAIAQSVESSLPLSIIRLFFDGSYDTRTSFDAARLVARLIRNIDFATRDQDGAILVVFTQTDLRDAHVAARRMAGALRNHILAAHDPRDKMAANVTLATLRNGDTIDSLLARVMDHRTVAAE